MIFLISLNSWGNDVVFLSKGQPSPYTGILFTEQQANELRRSLFELEIKSLENETLVKQRDFFESVVRIKESEVESYRLQNSRLMRSKESSNLERVIYFGLGVLATSLSVYAAKELVR